MSETRLNIGDQVNITDWQTYAGVAFPAFLITAFSLHHRTSKFMAMTEKIRSDLAQGSGTEDAGDAHGMFHNEYAWYKEQLAQGMAIEAENVGGKLHLTVVIEDYEQVREALQKQNIDPRSMVNLGSRILVQFGSDPADQDSFLVVSKLDSNARPNWVAVDSPFGRAVEGKKVGDVQEYAVNGVRTRVKIKSIE